MISEDLLLKLRRNITKQVINAFIVETMSMFWKIMLFL
jgi:hypothetical protein